MQIPYEIKARPDTGLWNAKIGIWLFLASEVMLFGGLFSGYVFLRLGSHGEADYFWPEGELNVWFGFINTLILILSSVFVVVAWLNLKLRDYKKFQVYMGLTVFCALVFLVNKGIEYNKKFNHYGIKLADNSIVHGHDLDDTVTYEGISEVTIDVARFNGEFLKRIDGEAPKFRVLDGEGKPTGDPVEITARTVRTIVSDLEEVLEAAHEEKNEAYKKENIEIREKNKDLSKADQVKEHAIVRWLPAMGVKQLSFVADSPFSITASRNSLRQALPEEVKFADKSSLKGTVSAKTPGLKLASIDRIDLRAADGENIEDSLVWKYIDHGKEAAQANFMKHRQELIDEAAAKDEEASYNEIHSQHVAHDKDHHTSIVVPWDQVRLYSNFTPKWNTFYAIYFLLTGLHGLHVLVGAGVLFYFGFMSKWHYDKDPEHLANRVEVGGLFWHFVDLVWIFLFPILYLM